MPSAPENPRNDEPGPRQAWTTFAASTDFTVGVEEEFSILDRATLDLVPRFEELRAAAENDEVLHEAHHRGADLSEIEIVSGAGPTSGRR